MIGLEGVSESRRSISFSSLKASWVGKRDVEGKITFSSCYGKMIAFQTVMDSNLKVGSWKSSADFIGFIAEMEGTGWE